MCFMKIQGLLAGCVILSISAFTKNNVVKNVQQKQDSVVAKGAVLRKVSDQFSFTEGASVDKQGNVFFTDQPNDKIWKYDIQGKVTVLLKDFEGHRFNGPNDLWEDLKGGIYFTDPYYQRPYWDRTTPDIKGEKVYYLAKGKKQAVVVADDLEQPNGIVGTPDGKFLFVADIKAGKTYKYKINADGNLSNKQLFCEQGSDGMTLDNEGNVYLTGDGVTVYNKEGKQIEAIKVPSQWTANLCFGGKNKNILFITASESVYTIEMRVWGVE